MRIYPSLANFGVARHAGAMAHYVHSSRDPFISLPLSDDKQARSLLMAATWRSSVCSGRSRLNQPWRNMAGAAIRGWHSSRRRRASRAVLITARTPAWRPIPSSPAATPSQSSHRPFADRRLSLQPQPLRKSPPTVRRLRAAAAQCHVVAATLGFQLSCQCRKLVTKRQPSHLPGRLSHPPGVALGAFGYTRSRCHAL